ncbi:RNA pseudouridine synthase [Curvibacter sp. PAE-UM]|uniref:RNA pseudouridine synthase n=1 Tax=Curvibacter sp. PAE-UM TaxID=1714344 RepID=UPI000709CFB3|nr:RNA pseudouridine synthase [Curvibacter sp. PAE-UM]KRI01708.1 RNA-binding protein [Curvibacter sp. PAE-UM]
MSEPVRLSKRLAALLPCSRSEAEQYIEGGWVRVNGQVVEEPHFRVQHEKIELDPNARLMELPPVTLLLHKPAGQTAPLQLLSAATHWQNDPSGIRVLKRHFSQLTPAVPLEPAASGLLVYSQDWRVTRKLTEDERLIEVEVTVEVQGEVSPAQLALLMRDTDTRGQPLPMVKASLNSSGDGRSKLRFAIKGVHSGLIAYVCERAGLQILSMKRIRIGRVPMTQLPPGQWRYLQAHERF